MEDLITFSAKIPRGSEVSPENTQTFLSTLLHINKPSFFQKILGKNPNPIALEITLFNQQIRFQITTSLTLCSFLQTQLQSTYPLVVIEKIEDSLLNLSKESIEITKIRPKRGNYYPILTYDNFAEIDPLSSLLSVLSKGDPDEISIIQIALESTNNSIQERAKAYAEKGQKNEDGTFSPRQDKDIIYEKISYPLFRVSIRLASNSKRTVSELGSAFGVFNNPQGNILLPQNISIPFQKKREIQRLLKRSVNDSNFLNIKEIATIWHLPSEKIKTSSILWGTSVLSEAPDNLPIAYGKTDEEKKHINFFAKTIYKNKENIFGIKDQDRRRHIWVIGKSGTGKSTLIANMAIDDFKKDKGVGIIDPHGDLCELLLNYIPRRRINEVIYFNPADKEYPITVNPLQVKNKEESELIVSGIISIFQKIFGFTWGPRLEYILRNSLLTLTEDKNATLSDVLLLLSNDEFRKKKVEKLKDATLKSFWINEFERMPENLKKESIAPIQNKVGQFVTSPLIRRIISYPKSSISIEDIINTGKIFIANLSQGKLGEDNSSLLGAMLITQIQIAAMRRVDIHEEERKDFYLYVDEFQNFATTSFIKILSEARKYRLNLMLANQYMGQIPEEVQKAILGNAGTLISFTVGATDANILHKEFAEVFSENDLVNLSNYQIAIRLMIDGVSSRPFLAHTLPLPLSRNFNKPKIIRVSRERWGKRSYRI